MSGTVPLIRLEGDKARCLELERRAKSELSRTKLLAARLGVSDYQRYVKVDADSYIITKVMRGKYDIINIVCNPYVPNVAITKEERKVIQEQKRILSIYSGFTRNDLIIENPGTEDEAKVLRDFNPTEECRRTNSELDEDQNYQDVTRLYIEKNPDITGPYPYPGTPTDTYTNASQYATVRPCQYTGLMAKAVSAILGYGNFNLSSDELEELLLIQADSEYITYVRNKGFQVLYDHRFTRCHAIVTGDDGVLWLVECSAINGIIAEPLRYLPRGLFKTSKEEDYAVGTVVDELGGLPLGNIFPDSRAEIEYMIDEGLLLELMTPEEYDNSLLGEWGEYSELNSWAFNDTGKAARVTAYKNDANGFKISAYLELAIRIDPINAGRVSSLQPIGTGKASIVHLKEPVMITCSYKQLMDSEGYPCTSDHHLTTRNLIARGVGSDITTKVNFYHPTIKGYTALSIYVSYTTWEANKAQIPDEMDAVIWVGWVDGKWEEATFHGLKYADLEDTYTENRHMIPIHGVKGQIGLVGFSPQEIMGGARQYYNPDSLPLIHWNHVTLTSVKSDPEQFKAAYHDHYWIEVTGYSTAGPFDKVCHPYNGPYSSVGQGWGALTAVYQVTINWKAYGCRFKDTFNQTWIWWPEYKCFATVPAYNRSAIYLVQEYIDDQTKDVYPGMNFTYALAMPLWSSQYYKIYSQVVLGQELDIQPTNGTPYLTLAIDSLPEVDGTRRYQAANNAFPITRDWVYDYWNPDHPLMWGAGTVDYTLLASDGGGTGEHPDEWGPYTWPTCSDWHGNAAHKPAWWNPDILLFDYWKQQKYVCDMELGWDDAWNRFVINGNVNLSLDGISIMYNALIGGGGTGIGSQCKDIASQIEGLAAASLPDRNFQLRDTGGYAIGKPWEPEYKGNAWLVCDSFGELLGKSYKHFGIKTDPDLTGFALKLDYHCQHAVIGEPAVIYSNVWSKRDDETFNIEVIGTVPELPETTDTHDYKVLTFIGVNSE